MAKDTDGAQGADMAKIEKKLLKKMKKYADASLKETAAQLAALTDAIARLQAAAACSDAESFSQSAPRVPAAALGCTAPRAAQANTLCRCEIIANQSVREDITEVLEAAAPGILYTVFPTVYGRGGGDRKLGSVTWPETNFVLVAYTDTDSVDAVKRAVSAVKERFATEGIKLFIIADASV